MKTGYRAEVVRLGVRASQVFPTMAAATAWAAVEEGKILSGTHKRYLDYTLAYAWAAQGLNAG